MTPTCATCAHAYTRFDQPKYPRCRKSGSGAGDDASLCGQMRKGACGPDATLWEPKNGQASE